MESVKPWKNLYMGMWVFLWVKLKRFINMCQWIHGCGGKNLNYSLIVIYVNRMDWLNDILNMSGF